MLQKINVVMHDITWKLFCVVCKVLIVSIFLIPRCLAGITRICLMAKNMYKARRGLTSEQKELLGTLWQATVEQRRYADAYKDGYSQLGRAAITAKACADSLFDECSLANIDNWRRDAYTLATYDYWWWFYLQFQWWE